MSRFRTPLGTLCVVFLVYSAVVAQLPERTVAVPCSLSGELEVRGIPKHVGSLAEHDNSGYVSAQGRWRLVSEGGHSIQLTRANSVDISCEKTTRKCKEAIASLWSKDDAKRVGMESLEGFLDVQTNEYDIIEWSNSLIRAIARLPVADIEIQISLLKETASRLYRERADKTSSPISNHYVLE